ncbi:sigma-70 family RNA polymerase sigma factor [Pseudonocardia sp. WMMC193]|uniref:sigma-70 family RNA polymerase sigma factor n=1 Tax=Pseudonocardia sp. WMMC193 TaxID=2911965 RepID=UPI001F00D84D|nr:sigma-70 family RNA polymerase sigma factor [Pseudonocardia sp. WMMC193]MCF7547460.1 sigma-70 family RNA polymerase sigma factor [Pseudonocardia sp. WMMC193]
MGRGRRRGAALRIRENVRPSAGSVVSLGKYGHGQRRAKMTATLSDTHSGTDDPTTEQVWREFGAQLRAFVRRRIVDPDRADDVLGEIMLRIHRSLDRVEDHDHLTRWVYRITRNAIIDEYRRAERDRARQGALLDDMPEEAAELEGEEQPSVLRELAACMRPLVEQLPAEQRRALQLSDLEGLTQADAASRENVSVSGMKSRVQRGRRRLAELNGCCCELTLDARGVPMEYHPPRRLPLRLTFVRAQAGDPATGRAVGIRPSAVSRGWSACATHPRQHRQSPRRHHKELVDSRQPTEPARPVSGRRHRPAYDQAGGRPPDKARSRSARVGKSRRHASTSW